jgi:hypothetical protein
LSVDAEIEDDMRQVMRRTARAPLSLWSPASQIDAALYGDEMYAAYDEDIDDELEENMEEVARRRRLPVRVLSNISNAWSDFS